jgi:hypothetical protein
MSALKVIRVYRYSRAALSSLIGLGFLVAGLFQTMGSSAHGSDLAWFILIFFFCQFFAFRAYRHTRDAAGEESFDELLARREARLAEKKAASGSVVGKICDQCDQRIVVDHDGCRCADCSAALHDICKTAHARDTHGNRVGAYR